MKYFLLIIFIFTGSSISACGNESQSIKNSLTVEISGCEHNESTENCCDDFCPCYCCTNIPVKVEIENISLLPTLREPTSLFAANIPISPNQKHWQPPKL